MASNKVNITPTKGNEQKNVQLTKLGQTPPPKKKVERKFSVPTYNKSPY